MPQCVNKAHVLNNHATDCSRVPNPARGVGICSLLCLVASWMVVCVHIWRRFSQKDKLDEEAANENQAKGRLHSHGIIFDLSPGLLNKKYENRTHFSYKYSRVKISAIACTKEAICCMGSSPSFYIITRKVALQSLPEFWLLWKNRMGPAIKQPSGFLRWPADLPYPQKSKLCERIVPTFFMVGKISEWGKAIYFSSMAGRADHCFFSNVVKETINLFSFIPSLT